MKYQGGCHCGAVAFEVEAPAQLNVTRCNCSICSMSGFLHLFVGKDDLNLLTDESAISTYTFNSGVAKHTFCKVCGIKSFYTPRSHPDGYSVNVNCLDVDLAEIDVSDFDGANWENNIESLKAKD